MTDHAQNCSNCRFAVDHSWSGSSDLRCHRYPPRNGDFVSVKASTWCGEHKPRAPKEEIDE